MYEILYPLLVAAFFALSSVMMKGLGTYGDPIRLNFFRSAVGAGFFIVHLLVAGTPSQLLNMTSAIVFFLVLSVVFNVVLGDTSFFASQEQIGVKIAQPLVNLYPLLTIFMAYLFLGEETTVTFVIGTVVIITGVILLSQGVDEEEKGVKLRGFLFAIAALVFYAAGVLAVTYATTEVDAIVANAVRMPAAAGFLLLMSLGRGEKRPSKPLDRRFAGLMLIAGFLGTYLSSYYLVLSAQTLGAGMTAVLTSLGPLFALPAAVFWLHEKVTPRIVVGTILTIIGLVIVLQ